MREFGIASTAIVQAGVMNTKGKSLMREQEALYSRIVSSIVDEHLPLDAMTIDETFEPRKIFEPWALQLSNSVGQERALSLPPWIPHA